MPFNVGDAVRLKTGGPEMTVEAVDTNSHEILCPGFAERVPQESRFKGLTLRKVEAKPAKLKLSPLL